MPDELLQQAGLALAYYAGLVFVMRAAGKRLAGLRKLGIASPREVRLTTLEETGHISVVADEPRAEGRSTPEVIPRARKRRRDDARREPRAARGGLHRPEAAA
jgi:hypothetical protein